MSNPIQAILTAGEQQFLASAQRTAGYFVSSLAPNTLPDAGAMVNAWMRGFLDGNISQGALANLGVLFQGNGVGAGANPYAHVWSACAESMKARPDPFTIMSALDRGFIEAPVAKALFTRSAADTRDFNFVRDTVRQWITPGELAVLRNRERITDDQWTGLLQAYGGYHPQAIGLFEELRHALPSITDLIQMAVKEAFSPDVAGPAGLFNEFPQVIAPFLAAQGLGRPLQGMNLPGGAGQATWGHLYWAAHWRNLAPTQNYEMLHRLRPNRIDRFKALVPGVSAWSMADVQRWLRISDYPQSLRDNLAAISARTLRLADIFRGLQLQLRDRDWAIEQFKDRGLLQDDAEFAADSQIEILLRQSITPKAEAIAVGLQLGEKTEADTINEIVRLGLSDRPAQMLASRAIRTRERVRASEKIRRRRLIINRHINRVARSYSIGTISRANAVNFLQGHDLDEDMIALVLNEAEFQRFDSLVQSTIARIRGDYWEGAVSLQGAAQALQRAGIENDAANAYLNQWEIEFDRSRRAATASRIVAWLKDFLISRDEALARLQRIGWSEEDALLYIAAAERDVIELQARQVSQAVKAQAAEARRLAQLARRHQMDLRRIQSDIRRLTPISTIKRWLRDGIVSPGWAMDRLSLMGYDEETILLTLREVGAEVSPEQVQEAIASAPGTLQSLVEEQVGEEQAEIEASDETSGNGAL